MMRYRYTLLFAALETRRADRYQNASRSCYWDCYWGYTGQLSANFFLSLVKVIKKLTAKTVDEDPTGCQRWISRKEI